MKEEMQANCRTTRFDEQNVLQQLKKQLLEQLQAWQISRSRTFVAISDQPSLLSVVPARLWATQREKAVDERWFCRDRPEERDCRVSVGRECFQECKWEGQPRLLLLSQGGMVDHLAREPDKNNDKRNKYENTHINQIVKVESKRMLQNKFRSDRVPSTVVMSGRTASDMDSATLSIGYTYGLRTAVSKLMRLNPGISWDQIDRKILQNPNLPSNEMSKQDDDLHECQPEVHFNTLRS